MSDAFITALDQRQLTHQEDRMTSQLNYLIAQQRQAERVSRAERARLASEARLAGPASALRWDPAQFGGRIPFVCAGRAAGAPMNATHRTPGCIGPKDLDDQVGEMYDRGVVPEEPRPAAPYADALAEAAGYPPLCVHGMNPLTDRGYDLAVGRPRRD